MSYILLYSERYGYLESFHNGFIHYTHDFHHAANYRYLDDAMRMRKFYNVRYDAEFHIEVFSAEG